MGKGTSWFLSIPILLLLVLSLSCCKSSEDKKQGDQTAAPAGGETASAYPAGMTEGLALGKKDNKLVMIELYDSDCNYCGMMNGSLADKQVLETLKDVVHKRISVKDKAVIEEFGLMQSPTFLFFKPDGEFLEPFVQGFRSPHVFAAEVANFKRRLAGQEELPVPEDPHPDYGKG